MSFWDFAYKFGASCYNFGYSIGDALARYLW